MIECLKCNKIFSSKQCLNYHISRNVCDKKTNGCENCGHIFKTKAMLKYHIEHNVCSHIKTNTKNTQDYSGE